MNAEMLRRRRRRYRGVSPLTDETGIHSLIHLAFLWSFLGALAYLAHRLVFLPPTVSHALMMYSNG